MEKISKDDLISKYAIELFKKRNSVEYNEELIKELENKLKGIDAFEEACKFIEKEIREEEEQKAVDEACKKLFEVLKDFSMWKASKLKKEVEEVKSILMKDTSYVGRLNLYEELMKLPNYKDLNEREKIRIAMKLGSLNL